jgi:hypothetical protein
MPALLDLQKRIRDQVLDRLDPRHLVGELRDDHPFPPEDRLGIYRNNTRIGLTEALAAAYPVVHRLVGPDFFARLAGDFIRAHPPVRAALLFYGTDFPAFVAAYGPAAGLPYLADVARLEAAWTQAYHAPDAVPLPPEALAIIPEEELGAVRLDLHPSLRFVVSDRPVLAIWEANQPEADGTVRLEPRRDPDRLIVFRPEAQVLIRRLSAGAFVFLMALHAGQDLESAWDSARAAAPDFAIGTEFAALLAAKLFIAARRP